MNPLILCARETKKRERERGGGGEKERQKKNVDTWKTKTRKITRSSEGNGSLSSLAATKPITSALDLQIRSGISILSALQIENAVRRDGPVWPLEEKKEIKKNKKERKEKKEKKRGEGGRKKKERKFIRPRVEINTTEPGFVSWVDFL